METDALRWYQMSAQGGHAGPGSSVPYIHQIEDAIGFVSKEARPDAWFSMHLDGVSITAFQDIVEGVLGARPPIPPRIVQDGPPQHSRDIGVQMREAIVWRVADGFKLQSVASEFSVSADLVSTVVEEMIQAMLLRQLVKQEVTLTTRKQCLALVAFFLWARAARQEKYQLFAKHLGRRVGEGDYKAMLQLWQDWSACQVDEFLALVNPRPAARIVNLLLKLGVSRKSLAASSMEGAAPLAMQLKQLDIPPVPCRQRGGRAAHRLMLSSKGVDAAKSSGATISMMGFHWWMLLLGSVLVAREEI